MQGPTTITEYEKLVKKSVASLERVFKEGTQPEDNQFALLGYDGCLGAFYALPETVDGTIQTRFTTPQGRRIRGTDHAKEVLQELGYTQIVPPQPAVLEQEEPVLV